MPPISVHVGAIFFALTDQQQLLTPTASLEQFKRVFEILDAMYCILLKPETILDALISCSYRAAPNPCVRSSCLS